MNKNKQTYQNDGMKGVGMETEYKVELKEFQGPLDLLLNLIEKRKLHINDISLAQITDDYLLYMKRLDDFPLRDTAHFILIASTLVLIKSRSLLPTLTLTDEEEGNIEDLETRLRLYKKIKELSIHTKELYGSNMIFYSEPIRHHIPVFSPTKEITLTGVLVAIQNVLNTLPKKEMIPQLIIEKVISLEEMIENLSSRMSKALSMSFREFTKGRKSDKKDIIVSFLAMLELVKRGIIQARQERDFSDIVMKGNE